MPKNIPGIVKRSRRRQGEKVRILVQPNPYPLEQPGEQPNVSGPMNPQMQPNGSSPMNPQMQPNGSSPMHPPVQPGAPFGPVPQPLQPGGFGNTPPLQPGGPVSMTPPLPGQVVPMQSSGQWRGDPNAQPPFPQGNNQPWQGGPGAPNGMPPQQAGYNNQQWPGNAGPMTPPQGQRPSTNPLPYNNMPVQQGRNTPPPASNIPSQPLSQPGQTPAPQYSPVQAPYNPSQPISQPGLPPTAQSHNPSRPISNSQYPPAMQGAPVAPRTPSNSGLLGRPGPTSLSGIAGTPTLSAPTAHIFVEIDGKMVQEVRLDKPVLTVGRQEGRDIQIKQQSVSRTHARLIAENGTWVVEDAGSVNGIVLHGQRVQRSAINNGDRIFVAPNIALLYKII